MMRLGGVHFRCGDVQISLYADKTLPLRLLPLRLSQSAYDLLEKSLHLRMTGFVTTLLFSGVVTRPEMLSLNTSPAFSLNARLPCLTVRDKR